MATVIYTNLFYSHAQLYSNGFKPDTYTLRQRLYALHQAPYIYSHTCILVLVLWCRKMGFNLDVSSRYVRQFSHIKSGMLLLNLNSVAVDMASFLWTLSMCCVHLQEQFSRLK